MDKSQEAANKLKEKYGEDSDRYKDAQRSIDAFGKPNVKNGVTIEIGDTGEYSGEVTVTRTIGPKSEKLGPSHLSNKGVARPHNNPTGKAITNPMYFVDRLICIAKASFLS